MLKNDESAGARSAHTRQVKQWVRELLVDGDAVTVMVGELECAEPGCPPRETVIALRRMCSSKWAHLRKRWVSDLIQKYAYRLWRYRHLRCRARVVWRHALDV